MIDTDTGDSRKHRLETLLSYAGRRRDAFKVAVGIGRRICDDILNGGGSLWNRERFGMIRQGN